MLKSLDPLLNADVLYALRAMGHGDDLIICDTNFPADSVAKQTVHGKLLRIDGVSAARVANAILSVMPLDSFVDKPAGRMEIVGKPKEIPPVQAEVQVEIDKAEGRSWPMGSIERFAFYELAKKAYCVIQTGETRFYGCFVFKKGVIPPDALMSKPRIAILGIFVADLAFRAKRLPVMGETLLGQGFAMGPGGKGSNQSVAAARAGGDVSFIAKLGRDSFGDIALKTWAADGIDTSQVLISDTVAHGRRLHLRVERDGRQRHHRGSGSRGHAHRR